jgi:hypothetical protein
MVMKSRLFSIFVAAGAAVVGSSAFLPSAADASTRLPKALPAAPCATLQLTAKPRINAQTAPDETIKNTVANCSNATETVVLTQHILGPFAARTGPDMTWTITLLAGQTVLEKQKIPYACCGTYTVKDKVTAGGILLAKKSTSFTFA